MTLIDVSHHQGTINWALVVNSVQDPGGVYLKITEGTANDDPNWNNYHTSATTVGLPVGAYHFADGGDPIAEADHFADQYLTASWQLDPVLDAEVSAVSPAWIVAFRARFRTRTGRLRFRVYAPYSFLTNQLDPAGWIDAHTSIWAARYALALGWTHPQLVLWQNTDSANIPGILGSVDTDQYQNGWTPAVDFGGTVSAPNTPDDVNLLAFVATGGPATRIDTMAAFVAAGGDPTSLFGRTLDIQLALTEKLPAIVGALTSLTATVDAIKASLPVSTLTGTATVTVNLTEGGPSA